jgi:hypothetical protein
MGTLGMGTTSIGTICMGTTGMGTVGMGTICMGTTGMGILGIFQLNFSWYLLHSQREVVVFLSLN